MEQRVDQFSEIIESRYQDAQQVNRVNAVRAALGQLDPHADDNQQPYGILLQRLQAAIVVELQKLA